MVLNLEKSCREYGEFSSTVSLTLNSYAAPGHLWKLRDQPRAALWTAVQAADAIGLPVTPCFCPGIPSRFAPCVYCASLPPAGVCGVLSLSWISRLGWL